jgi:hypothetical protein
MDNTNVKKLGIAYAARLKGAASYGVSETRQELHKIGQDLNSWNDDRTGQRIGRAIKEAILIETAKELGLDQPNLVIAAFDEAHTAALSSSSFLQMVAQISALVKQIKR